MFVFENVVSNMGVNNNLPHNLLWGKIIIDLIYILRISQFRKKGKCTRKIYSSHAKKSNAVPEPQVPEP